LEQEIQLQGGNVSGGVVRIGETLHRPMGPWSLGVHALLRHLEVQGFDGAPRFLGIDQQGREILTFIAGEIGHYPLPDYMWSDEALIAVSRLLRHYHEAQAGFVAPEQASWQFTYPDTSAHEIICHNDVAPYNMVYRDGKPHALIDFDEAGPGPRVWDIAYATYRFVPLVHARDSVLAQAGLTDPGRQARRLQLFCDTYQIRTGEVLAMVEPRLQAMCTALVERAGKGNMAFQKMIDEGHLAHYQQELADLQVYRPLLERRQARNG
jgi:hypothetical protein